MASIEAYTIIDPTLEEPVIGLKVPIPTAKALLQLEYVTYIYHFVRFKTIRPKSRSIKF